MGGTPWPKHAGKDAGAPSGAGQAQEGRKEPRAGRRLTPFQAGESLSFAGYCATDGGIALRQAPGTALRAA